MHFTVRQLHDIISKLPDDAPVVISKLDATKSNEMCFEDISGAQYTLFNADNMCPINAQQIKVCDGDFSGLTLALILW